MIPNRPHVGKILEGPRRQELEILRWKNLEAMEFIENTWGFIPDYDPEFRARAFPRFAFVIGTMWDHLYSIPLHALYLYRPEIQKNESIIGTVNADLKL